MAQMTLRIDPLHQTLLLLNALHDLCSNGWNVPLCRRDLCHCNINLAL